MKDYESGFLALILTGILMIVIGLGLVTTVGRSPDGSRASLVGPPSPVFAMRNPPPADASPAAR